MEVKNDIMVSVICTAYNHEKYIRQCLDGFVMQKTNFIFEVIVHDDASTDKTADIIREYQKNIRKSLSQFFKKLINTRKELMSAN
ncbi:glycosyltransferase [uncultured Ruminococcus sp.]|uniref:glycosyltransferase family 2 protein n=1 Tax=uncultured Ruminococcus sp. TaxID=165186 RepID=UPI0025F1F333|nr:glycosyltransferase [uncultured Ruminococcus sp.]